MKLAKKVGSSVRVKKKDDDDNKKKKKKDGIMYMCWFILRNKFMLFAIQSCTSFICRDHEIS